MWHLPSFSTLITVLIPSDLLALPWMPATSSFCHLELEHHIVLSSKKYWHLPSHRSSSRLLLSFSFRFVFGVTHEQQLLINSARLNDSFPEFAILSFSCGDPLCWLQSLALLLVWLL